MNQVEKYCMIWQTSKKQGRTVIMILFIECIISCLIFGAAIIGSVLLNKESWLHEYAPEVQQRYLEKNPQYKSENKTKPTAALIIAKVIVSIVFAVLLSGFAYIAGARSFGMGFLFSYIIWFIVNLFDVIVLDIWILAHWKKARLPGTEDMDEAYASNKGKSIRDGLYGLLIGIPVSCLCGLLIMLVS